MMNILFAPFKFIRKFWISILLCAVILALCFMQTDELPEAPMSNFDKWVHLLMFMGMSGVVFFDNTSYLRRATDIQHIFFGSFLFSVFLGGLIEIAQGLFLSYRSGDWLDFLFDAIGAFIGLLICLLINRRLKPQSNG